MRAEQEPDPRGPVALDLFKADSKSSRSPPSWKSLNQETADNAKQQYNLRYHEETFDKGNHSQEPKWVDGERLCWK